MSKVLNNSNPDGSNFEGSAHRLSNTAATAGAVTPSEVDEAGAVMETDFSATSFLYATAADTPLPKTPAEVRTVLNVADGATANDTDANLKARANHTGTQAASTISDFDTEVTNNTAVAANTAKTGITSGQASAIVANTAKTGITSGQASAITANTAKETDVNHNVTTDLSVSRDGTKLDVVSSDGTNAVLPLADTDNWGVMSDEMFDKLDGIEAGATAEAAATTTTAGIVELATNAETTTGTDTARAVTPAGVQAAVDSILDGAPAALDTLNELAAAIDDDASYASTITTALGLKAPKASPTFTGTVAIPNVANLETAVVANTAKTGITSGQASAITANTAKTGITSGQASAIVANTAKTGITSGQASAITANTAKTGITSGQASAITANTAKATNATHTGEVTGDAALTIAADVVDEANLKVGGTLTDNYVLTADTEATGGMKWAAGGSGNVSKVGIPADSQVGVWTGNGTIEGTSSLVFDSTGLGIGTSGGYASAALEIQSSVLTEPVLLINSNYAGPQAGQLILRHGRTAGALNTGDVLGDIIFQGFDSGGGLQNFGSITGNAADVTAGSENGTLSFKTFVDGASAERMQITSAGDLTIAQSLGIGTTVPSSMLHLEGDTANSDYLAYFHNSGQQPLDHGLNVQIGGSSSTAYGLRINTGGNSDSLAVMGDGKVGINTATPTLVKLDVVGAIGQSGAVWTTGARANSLVIDNNGGAARFHAVGADATTMGSFDFYTAETDGGALSRMTISAAGRVGIGTDSPTSKIDINHTAASAGGEGSIGFRDGATSYHDFRLDSSHALHHDTWNGSAWISRMSTTMEGLVGIGRTPSTFPLEVEGAICAKGGTVSLAGFTFNEDTDTGMFNSAANHLDFYTGSNRRVLIDDAGLVGIGRTPSTYALEVEGTAYATTTANGGYGVWGNSGNASTTGSPIGVYGSVSSTVDNSATSGIGVYAVCGGSPTTGYGVYSQCTGTSSTTNYGGYFTATGATNNYGLVVAAGFVGIGTDQPKRHLGIHNSAAASTKIQITNSATGISSDGVGFQLGIGGDGTANIEQRENLDLAVSTNNTERLRITAAGLVGIGRTPTAEKLEVLGSAIITGYLYSGGNVVKNQTADSSGLKMTQETGDESRIFNNYNGPLTLGTNNTERMRITSGGAIKIASASTGASSASNDLKFYGTTTGSSQVNQGLIKSSTWATNSNAGVLEFHTANTSNAPTLRMAIDGGGDCQWYNGSGAVKMTWDASMSALGIGGSAGYITNDVASITGSGDVAAGLSINNQTNSGDATARLTLGAYGADWHIETGAAANNSNSLTFKKGAVSTDPLFTIASGGDVKIEESLGVGGTPTSKFGVYGTNGNFTVDSYGQTVNFTRDGSNYLYANAGSSSSLRLQGQHSLQFSTGASQTERLRITNAGNVGLGTAAAGVDLAGSTGDRTDGVTLHLKNSSGPAYNIIESSTLAELHMIDSGGTSGDRWARWQMGGDKLKLDFLADNGSSFTTENALVIDPTNGKIGIGTDSPTYALGVIGPTDYRTVLIGNIVATGIKRTAIAGRHYTSTEEPVNLIGMYGDSTSTVVAVGGGLGVTGDFNSATQLEFHTAANNTSTATAARMTIDSAGLVGIGVAVPSSELHVKTATTSGVTNTSQVGIRSEDARGGGAIYGGSDMNHSILFRYGQDDTVNTVNYHSYGSHRFYTNASIQSQVLALEIDNTQRVTVKKSSNSEFATTITTSGADIELDFDDADNFNVTLNSVADLPNPTNITVGQSGCIVFDHGQSLTDIGSWGDKWHFEEGAQPSLSEDDGAIDNLAYFVASATSIHAVLLKNMS